MNSEFAGQSVTSLPAPLERKEKKYITVSPSEKIYGFIRACKEGVLAAAYTRAGSGSGGMGKTVRIHVAR